MTLDVLHGRRYSSTSCLAIGLLIPAQQPVSGYANHMRYPEPADMT
jgi:hypothetical protein